MERGEPEKVAGTFWQHLLAPGTGWDEASTSKVPRNQPHPYRREKWQSATGQDTRLAMESFFTNVQVRRGPGTALETIELALDAFAAQAGMVRGSPDADAYDRTIVVRAGEGDWISVCDEATEDQDTTGLDMLAAILSAATLSTVVSILVHDSDVLLLGLFVNGKKVDEFNSDPMYMEGAIPADMGPTAEQVAGAAGNADHWKHVLVPGATPQDLTQVWRETELDAEAQLGRVAELLGCSPDRVRVGLNYFEFGEVPSTELLILTYVYAARGKAQGPQTSYVN